MPSHVYPAELYFKHIFSRYLIETLAQFSKELQPLLSGEGKAGEVELGLALRALSQRLCLHVQEIFQISVSHNGEVSPWKWWAKIRNTSTGIAVDCGYLAQSWIFAPGTGFHKDAAKKTGGLSEFIIRLLRDVWPVRQHQSVALKFETCWSEMLQCLDALYSGETKNAEPSVFNMPLRTGNTWERLVSTGVILASSHESIGEKSRHQLGSGPAAGSFCAQECAEGGWIGYIYIYVYI